jgi:plasmid stabilization system protein ParE
VDYLPGAQLDIEESATWYETKEIGVGSRFEAAVALAEKKLQRAPLLGRPYRRHTRKWRVPHFPHNVIYREEPDRILIVAIAHPKREDDYWDERVP